MMKTQNASMLFSRYYGEHRVSKIVSYHCCQCFLLVFEDSPCDMVIDGRSECVFFRSPMTGTELCNSGVQQGNSTASIATWHSNLRYTG